MADQSQHHKELGEPLPRYASPKDANGLFNGNCPEATQQVAVTKASLSDAQKSKVFESRLSSAGVFSSKEIS